MRKTLLISGSLVVFSTSMVFYAFRGTQGKTDIEFKIHINEKLIQESAFGESPTFAIWLEDLSNGMTQTVFVTRRAAAGDWEGKAEVPAALPCWFKVHKLENENEDLPTLEKPAPLAITGATPKPGYFLTRVRVQTGTRWICWIEVNLSGDYNDTYLEYDSVKKAEDLFGIGQPALLYRAEIEAIEGRVIIPDIAGVCIADSQDGNVIQPPKGISTASRIFDELTIAMVKPNPKILQ